jgi:hypothetical protein
MFMLPPVAAVFILLAIFIAVAGLLRALALQGVRFGLNGSRHDDQEKAHSHDPSPGSERR